MKRRVTILVLCASVFAGTPALAPSGSATPLAPPVADAKPCGAGWKHAALPWGHKCLRRGQFCKSGQDRSYHRFGYHCHTGRLR